MLSRLSVKFKRGGRRPRSHGGYSFLATGQLPENRVHILKYLMAVREGLIRDLGPTENDLSTAQIILIDRIVSKIGIVRCQEEYAREHSVMDGNELTSCLKTSYLAYSNSIRLDLQALGITKKTEDAVLTPYEIVRADASKKEESNEHN